MPLEKSLQIFWSHRFLIEYRSYKISIAISLNMESSYLRCLKFMTITVGWVFECIEERMEMMRWR